MARRHLAIFLKKTAEKVLAGEKEVELRLSQHKVLPYGAVAKEDVIYVKNSGGKIIGQVTVDNVLYYDHIDSDIFRNLRHEYEEASLMDKDFWDKKRNSSFASIIFLKNPIKFLAPLAFQKHDRRPWVIIEENKDN